MKDAIVALALVRGSPESERTNFAKLELSNFLHLDVHQWFAGSTGRYESDSTEVKNAYHYCRVATEAALKDCLSVAVSSPFAYRCELDQFLDIADKCGVDKIWIFDIGYQFRHYWEIPNNYHTAQGTLVNVRTF